MYIFRIYSSKIFEVVVDSKTVAILADFLESNKEVYSFTVWSSVTGCISQNAFGFGGFTKWEYSVQS